MNQQQQHSLLDKTSQMESLLLSLTLEVAHSIFRFSKSQMEYLKLKLPTEIQTLEVKILTIFSRTILFRNSRILKESIFPKINWLFKELKRPLRKQRLNFLLLNRLKSTCLISLLMQLDQSICSSRLIEPSLNLSHKNL